jgi:gas vesicle protein
MMTKGKFVVGALIGAAAGLVAGLLTAPKSGKETRADIKEKAAELKSEAAKRGERAKDKTVEIASDVNERFDVYKQRGEHVVDTAKKGFFSKK